MMNCGVDYEDGYWAEQPAVVKKKPEQNPISRSTTTKRPGALRHSKPGTGYHASAQECVGPAGSFKDLSHGSRIVTRARWGHARASAGRPESGNKQ